MNMLNMNMNFSKYNKIKTWNVGEITIFKKQCIEIKELLI